MVSHLQTNNSTVIDKVVDILTLGLGSKLIKLPSYISKGAKYVNKGASIYTTGTAVGKEYEKNKKKK
jgi:hypothetical protein